MMTLVVLSSTEFSHSIFLMQNQKFFSKNKKYFVYLLPKIYNLKKTFSCHDNILFSNSFIYPQLSDRQDFFQISIELFVLLLFMYLFPKSSKVVYTLLVSFTCTNLSFFVVMVTA